MTPSTILEHDGIKQPITEWALDYGITPAIIIGRLERGESITSAITTPMKVGFRGQKLASGDMEAFIARSLRGWKRERRKARRGRHKIGQTYTHDGKTMTIQEWSEVTGLKIVTIRARLYADWSIDKVLSSPAERTVTRPKTKHTRASLARAVGIDPSTVSSRLRRGWQLEDALTIEAGSRMGRFARGLSGGISRLCAFRGDRRGEHLTREHQYNFFKGSLKQHVRSIARPRKGTHEDRRQRRR